MNDSTSVPSTKLRHRWPWIVAVLVVVVVILSVMSIRHEARRVHELRQMQMPSSAN